eukprot:3587292-Pleurochrysis_carterae.AAC.1
MRCDSVEGSSASTGVRCVRMMQIAHKSSCYVRVVGGFTQESRRCATLRGLRGERSPKLVCRQGLMGSRCEAGGMSACSVWGMLTFRRRS